MERDDIDRWIEELVGKDVSKIDQLLKDCKTLGDQVDDMICWLEVEDFLLNGPGGVDPL